jgi:hypothetical protein
LFSHLARQVKRKQDDANPWTRMISKIS